MTSDQNKEVVRRFFEELWNDRRLELAEELISDNCSTHQLRAEATDVGVPRAPTSVKHEMVEWLTGFPDIRFRIEQIIAEGDRVVSHCTILGKHSGQWSGVESTGRSVEFPMIVIHRLENGKIVEDWVLVGALVLFQQLGLVHPTDALLAAGKAETS